jgi:uncharacterized ion transporter superfamily protein YfcC
MTNDGILLLVFFSIVIFLVSIILIYKYLKREKEGYIKLMEAAEMMENQVFKQASDKLLQSNQFKFLIFYLNLLLLFFVFVSFLKAI